MNIHQAFDMRLSVVESLPPRLITPRRKKGESNEALIGRILAADVQSARLIPIRDIEAALDADNRAVRTPTMGEAELSDLASLKSNVIKHHSR
jgi:hypothetical protein